ncbi:unnamed protein product, partial [Polarella glacialis]
MESSAVPAGASRVFSSRQFPSSALPSQLRYKVQLAVTALSPSTSILGLPVAYHSSIVINNEEYSFSRAGLVRCRHCLSHKHLHGPSLLLDMGESALSAGAMVKELRSHFRENTYDLLLKNCNHFSDCALFFLLGQRLPEQYKAAEQLGASVERSM